VKAKNPGASRRILERKRERERWGGMGEGNEICLRVECGDCLRRKISKSHIFNASATADTKPTTVFLRPTLRPSTSPLQILSSPSLSLSIHLFLSFFLFIGILSEILSTISFFLLLLLLLFFFCGENILSPNPFLWGRGEKGEGGVCGQMSTRYISTEMIWKQCSFFFMSEEEEEEEEDSLPDSFEGASDQRHPVSYMIECEPPDLRNIGILFPDLRGNIILGFFACSSECFMEHLTFRRRSTSNLSALPLWMFLETFQRISVDSLRDSFTFSQISFSIDVKV